MTQQEQQIDLIQLAVYFWGRKHLIILTGMIFILPASIYIHFATEKWQTNARISFNRNVNSSGAQLLSELDIIYNNGEKILITELYNAFTHNLSAENIQDDFFHRLPSELPTNQLVITKEKESIETHIINFITEVNDDSKLGKLLNRINVITIKSFSLQYITKIEAQIKLLDKEQKNTASEYTLKKTARIKKIRTAINNAKAPNNKTTAATIAALQSTDITELIQSPFLFLLSKDDLQKALSLLQGSAPIYPESYYKNITKKANLEDFLSRLKILNLQIFQYEKKPTILQKKHPKTLLIYILSLIIGICFSITIFLLYYTFSQYNKKKHD